MAPEATEKIPNLSAKLPRLTPRRREPKSQTEAPPPTGTLPPPLELKDGYEYTQPIRRIIVPSDMELFQASPAYSLITSFVFTLSDSVRGRPKSSIKAETLSPALKAVGRILDEIDALITANPALDTGSRFGNPVFKAFHSAVAGQADKWHAEMLNIESADARKEISTYLTNCLGAESRLDYGSGHELSFVVWLLCLYQVGIVKREDFPALVLHTFEQYLQLMRRIQTTYYLEPAGSHGVWGLDDYHFMPFLFGAAQLVAHPYITPMSIHNAVVLEEEAGEYMYLDQVRWVDSVKTVKGLRWHSPMLDDISSAKNWSKVEGGMRKMFVKEVLGKLPIMQHFLFGSLVPAKEEMGQMIAGEHDGEDDGNGHSHAHGAHEQGEDWWGDCCGIKVPSTIAAGQEQMKRNPNRGLRPIPFD